MRKKEEILEKNKNALPSSTKALVEVLIDIRDLLIEHKIEVTLTTNNKTK